jgi:hypothetical protein
MPARAINFRFFIWVNHDVFDVLYREIPHIDTPDNMCGVVKSVFWHGALPDTIKKANESSLVFTTAQNSGERYARHSKTRMLPIARGAGT